MTKENLFRNNIFKSENNPEKELIDYNKTLKKFLKLENNIPKFDLIILGLGEDGHTASLFPNEFLKFRNKEECVIATHPNSGQKRISLSEKIINNANEVIFYVPGSGKKYVVDEIVNKRGNFNSYPASYIKPVSGKLYWYLDLNSSEMLTKQ